YLDDEVFDDLKRSVVIPAIYKCFIEVPYTSIQSTGQKSRWVETGQQRLQCSVLIRQLDFF
ncbi:senescence-associated protein, partial [Clonorchis sinensis]